MQQQQQQQFLLALILIFFIKVMHAVWLLSVEEHLEKYSLSNVNPQ
jgi:hypothetical protein